MGIWYDCLATSPDGENWKDKIILCMRWSVICISSSGAFVLLCCVIFLTLNLTLPPLVLNIITAHYTSGKKTSINLLCKVWWWLTIFLTCLKTLLPLQLFNKYLRITLKGLAVFHINIHSVCMFARLLNSIAFAWRDGWKRKKWPSG
jgi:hypothetical protein